VARLFVVLTSLAIKGFMSAAIRVRRLRDGPVAGVSFVPCPHHEVMVCRGRYPVLIGNGFRRVARH